MKNGVFRLETSELLGSLDKLDLLITEKTEVRLKKLSIGYEHIMHSIEFTKENLS